MSRQSDTTTPHPVSPLGALFPPGQHGAIGDEGPGLTLHERRPARIMQLTAWPDTVDALDQWVLAATTLALPRAPGTTRDKEGLCILNMGPGRFWIIAEEVDPAREPGAPDMSLGVATTLSDAHALVRVEGAAAARLMMKAMAIDLNEGTTPPGRVIHSAIHHMPVTLHRLTEDCFDIYVFRGFAVSLWQWLMDAGLEFGIEITESRF